MIGYLAQRCAWSLVMLLGITLVVFLVVHLSGDPAALYMGPEGTKEDYEILRAALGFDRPLVEQYGRFLARAVQGDFGRSLRHRQPTLPLVLERFPATIMLAFAAIVSACDRSPENTEIGSPLTTSENVPPPVGPSGRRGTCWDWRTS